MVAQATYLYLLHGSAGSFFDPTWPLNAPTSETRLQFLHDDAHWAYFPSTMLLGCVTMMQFSDFLYWDYLPAPFTTFALTNSRIFNQTSHMFHQQSTYHIQTTKHSIRGALYSINKLQERVHSLLVHMLARGKALLSFLLGAKGWQAHRSRVDVGWKQNLHRYRKKKHIELLFLSAKLCIWNVVLSVWNE